MESENLLVRIRYPWSCNHLQTNVELEAPYKRLHPSAKLVQDGRLYQLLMDMIRVQRIIQKRGRRRETVMRSRRRSHRQKISCRLNEDCALHTPSNLHQLPSAQTERQIYQKLHKMEIPHPSLRGHDAQRELLAFVLQPPRMAPIATKLPKPSPRQRHLVSVSRSSRRLYRVYIQNRSSAGLSNILRFTSIWRIPLIDLSTMVDFLPQRRIFSTRRTWL
jgi:hypothetical protein